MPNENKPAKTEYQISLIKDFVKGNINRDEYVQKRKYHGNQRKWTEMTVAARDVLLFNRFLMKLPISDRIKALLEVQQLVRDDIRKMSEYNNGGHLDRFFTQDYWDKRRGFSKSIMELAIIFDTPSEYLNYDQDQQAFLLNHDNSFMEYRSICPLISIEFLLSEITKKTNNRMIRGYRVINTSRVFNVNSNEVYTRVDKRKSFFMIQFHVESRSCVNDRVVEYLLRNTQVEVKKVYVSLAFLRDTFIITLFGTYEGIELDSSLGDAIENYKKLYKPLEYNI